MLTGFGLLQDVKITKVSGEVSAGTSAVNGTVLDMSGFEGVIFVAHYGTSATDNGLHAEGGEAANLSDAADLEGTQVFLDGTEEMSILDVVKPRERYIRCVADRGTSSTIGAIIAIQYGSRTEVDNDSSTDNSAEQHVSPAEGTK